jgi:hypothetical protein
MQHQHNDGSWGNLEPRAPHSPAELDPEREWATGVIYACTRCDEVVRVVQQEDDKPPL